MSTVGLDLDRKLDVAWVRSQFPSLGTQFEGQTAAFLDGPAGTQVPARVIGAVQDYLMNSNANTGGAFPTSRHSDEMIANTRVAMADFFHCDPHEVVFGPNMTTLTFAMSRAIERELGSGDEILLTTLDHDANFSPWKALEERGVVIRVVDIHEEDCTLDLDDLTSKLSDRTKFVAVGYASNAVGTINPVREITRLAHAAGAMTFIDAVHYAPHGLMDVEDLDCDFLVCSPYKFFGPHMGTLFGKREHLERFQPYKVRPWCVSSRDKRLHRSRLHRPPLGPCHGSDPSADDRARNGAQPHPVHAPAWGVCGAEPTAACADRATHAVPQGRDRRPLCRHCRPIRKQRSSVLLVDLDVRNWVAQQRSHFFLNFDNQLGILQFLGQAGDDGLLLAVLLDQRADNYLGAALLGCEGIELPLFALPPPGAHVRRVQAFAAQQGAYRPESWAASAWSRIERLYSAVKRRRTGRATTSESETRGRRAGGVAPAALAASPLRSEAANAAEELLVLLVLIKVRFLSPPYSNR